MVNSQWSAIETHQCVFNFIGIIDTSLLGLLMAHSPLLIALKKSVVCCLLSVDFYYLCHFNFISINLSKKYNNVYYS